MTGKLIEEGLADAYDFSDNAVIFCCRMGVMGCSEPGLNLGFAACRHVMPSMDGHDLDTSVRESRDARRERQVRLPCRTVHRHRMRVVANGQRCDDRAAGGID